MKDLYVDALSRGMQQRVAIARTLIHDPQMIILDEPANGLDPQARIDMRVILLRLAELGKTLIVTSHILPELARVCDLVAMITKGKLRAFGTVDDIMRDIRQRRTFEVLLLDEGQVDTATSSVERWFAQQGENKQTSATINGEKAESLVRFTTDMTDQDLSGLLQHLVKDDVPVAQFRELTTDLEDAFLSVTGAAESAESASSETEESVEASAS